LTGVFGEMDRRVLDMSPKREIKRVALYCRVSTGGQSTAMQADELRRMAEARNWEVVTVVEEKISGRKLRPARQRLITDAKAGNYDAVMVWKLDRWGRSTADLVSSIKDLDESGVTFVSLKDGIDLSTSAGRLVANVLASIAEFEADGIRERVTAGVRHAQRHGTRSGKAIGRPSIAAARSVEVRALRSQGLSLPAIVDKTGLSYGSVHRLVNAR
jgi:DNA invertase Pin-like site-specific DNA recombinase